jgi:NAD(P)-dependent dehydrogenase (short-subunit alcohol dehydrogenase family)
MNLGEGKLVLITGASSGIGKECALQLQREGYRVVGASRKSQLNTPFKTVEMDLNDEESVRAAFERVKREFGNVDVLINNAGFTIAGPIELTPISDGKRLMDTMFWGPILLSQLVLPGMREKRSGVIVNISSIAGKIALPFQGLYCAAKFALEGMTEALRMEVLPFGVKVVLVEPGDHKTAITKNREKPHLSDKANAYERRFSNVLEIVESNENQSGPPCRVSQLISRVLKADAPRLRHPVGSSKEQAFIFLKSILPQDMFEGLVRSHYGLN